MGKEPVRTNQDKFVLDLPSLQWSDDETHKAWETMLDALVSSPQKAIFFDEDGDTAHKIDAILLHPTKALQPLSYQAFRSQIEANGKENDHEN